MSITFSNKQGTIRIIALIILVTICLVFGEQQVANTALAQTLGLGQATSFLRMLTGM